MARSASGRTPARSAAHVRRPGVGACAVRLGPRCQPSPLPSNRPRARLRPSAAFAHALPFRPPGPALPVTRNNHSSRAGPLPLPPPPPPPAHSPEPAAELRPAGSGTATAPRSRRHERPRSPRVPGPAFLTRGKRASPRRAPSAPPGPAPAGGAGLSRPPPRLAHLSPAPRLCSARLSSAAGVESGPSFRPVFPPTPVRLLQYWVAPSSPPSPPIFPPRRPPFPGASGVWVPSRPPWCISPGLPGTGGPRNRGAGTPPRSRPGPRQMEPRARPPLQPVWGGLVESGHWLILKHQLSCNRGLPWSTVPLGRCNSGFPRRTLV